ncbi:hypothetical protein BH24ACT12_BH24ACT12_19880 [soil metagenome]
MDTDMTHPDPKPGSETAQVAQGFLSELEAMNIDAALAAFAGTGDALRRQYGGLPEAYTGMRFDVSAVVPRVLQPARPAGRVRR